jgi:hypothetical protein
MRGVGLLLMCVWVSEGFLLLPPKGVGSGLGKQASASALAASGGGDDYRAGRPRGPPRKKAPRRPRPRSPSSFDARDYISDEPVRRKRAPVSGKNYKEQRMEWWKDTSNVDQNGFMRWLRDFYNALFWYGVAFDDEEDFVPAMDFKDLMEQYDTEEVASPSSRTRAPEGDWGYRWRPGKGKSTQDEDDLEEEDEDDSYYYEEEEMEVRGIGEEEEDDEFFKEEELEEPRGETEARLARKAQALDARRRKIQRNLSKIEERLAVLDTTLELWLGRKKAMTEAGEPEDGARMLSAKRRIYDVRKEGQQLEEARDDMLRSQDNIIANMSRIKSELDGAAPVKPAAVSTPLEIPQSPSLQDQDLEEEEVLQQADEQQ